MKAYLLALEIQDVEVGRVYSALPLHCTLVHWFWVDDSAKLLTAIQSIIETLPVQTLFVEDEEEFTGITKSGPIGVKVNKVMKTSGLAALHDAIATFLEEAGVTYVMPQYIHDGYIPHVTHQHSGRLNKGDKVQVSSVYLVDADAPEYGNERIVIRKFNFKA